MKKIVSIWLCLLIVLTLTACETIGNGAPSVSEPSSESIGSSDRPSAPPESTGKTDATTENNNETESSTINEESKPSTEVPTPDETTGSTETDPIVETTTPSETDPQPPEPSIVDITSLKELTNHVGNLICIEGLEIVSISGDIYDNESEAKITVTDGTYEGIIVIPADLDRITRTVIADKLKYPIAGDIIDLTAAPITEETEVKILLNDPDQVEYMTPTLSEIDFGGCTPINQIENVGNYSSRGRVVARSNNQFILQDETGAILVYSNYAADLEVGKCYKISGEVVIYAKGLEYKNISAPTPIEDIKDIKVYEPLIMQTKFVDAFVIEFDRIPCTYIEYYGKLEKSGNYNNLALSYASNVKVSVNTHLNLSDYYGKYVVIQGYLTGVNGGSPYYLQTVMESIRLAAASPAKPTEIKIVGCDGQVEPYSQTQLSVEYLNNADVEKEITWSVNDGSGATIDDYGLLKCMKEGRVTVTATTANGIKDTMEIECRLTKKINPEKVINTLPEISFDVGEIYSYLPEFYPSNANNRAYISYEIGDEKIASVNEKGEITALAYGSTLLRVKLAGSNTVLIPIHVEPYYEYGNNVIGVNEKTEYQIVTSIADLRAVFLDASFNGYRTIFVDFNLPEAIELAEILHLKEYHYLSNSINHRVMEGENSMTFRDQKVRFRFNGWSEDYRKIPYVTQTDENAVVLIPNAASVLRQQTIAQSPYRRGDEFENFPICSNNKGTIDAYNVTQLLFVVEQGYLPTFPLENSKAEQIYEVAKDILRSIITNDMTELERCKAIFDYVCENTVYANDYWMTGSASGAPEQSIIGMIDRGRTVCEGYAEAFMLLARIEGIEAYRASGYKTTSGAGHAWNYVIVDGKYYRVCTQYSDSQIETPEGWKSPDDIGNNLQYHTYGHFMVSDTTFANSFPKNNMPKDVEFSLLENPLTDKIPGTEYDYAISSEQELAAVMKAVVDLDLTGRYYLVLKDDGVNLFDQRFIKKALSAAGFDGKFHIEVAPLREGDTSNTYVVFFNENPK